MTLKQYLPLFEEVLKSLKSNNYGFICNHSIKFRKLWEQNSDFKKALFEEIFDWESCTDITRRVLVEYDPTSLGVLFYGDESRLLFFTHLINKIKNA